MSLKKHILLILSVLLAMMGSSCLKSKKPGIPIEVQQSLNNSGIRKPDLMKVLLEFQRPEDSLKLQSAYFLIRNLESNYTIRWVFSDTADIIIESDTKDFPDYASIKKYRDSIAMVSGKLSYKVDTILLDIYNLNSGFLIGHINDAFSTWQKSTWDNKYDFNTFCNSILPYRVANEDVEPFTKHFQEKYKHLVNQNQSIAETAILLNNEINDELSYDERLVINPNPQPIATIEKNRTGNLLNINIYKIKALRSLGIAAALDYTPFFADSTFGCHSTAVIFPDNSEIVLSNPNNRAIPYPQGKVAKVYRRSHNNDPESLFSIKSKKTHTPPFLGNYNYLDVTCKYLQTTDVSIHFADTTQFVYLSVFNENKWQPVEWARAGADGKAHFLNMGIGVRYMPVVVLDERVVTVGREFFLSGDN